MRRRPDRIAGRCFASGVADLVDDDVARGQKLVLVQYCCRYRTFDIPRHSLVCYYYRKGVSVRNSLNLCEFEQKAN